MDYTLFVAIRYMYIMMPFISFEDPIDHLVHPVNGLKSELMLISLTNLTVFTVYGSLINIFVYFKWVFPYILS